MILQNASDAPVEGTLDLWGVGFSVRLDLTIAPHRMYVYNTRHLLPDVAGALTFAHDAPYRAVTGKAVALDPSTGFSFDTPFTSRPR